MQLSPLPHSPRRRLTALAVTLAAHLLLFALWRLHHPVPGAQDEREAAGIQWIRTLAVTPPAPPSTPLPQPSARIIRDIFPGQFGTDKPVRPAPATEAPPPAPASVADDPVFANVPAAPSLHERILKDIGKIDKGLRKESPGNHIVAAPNTPQTRLAAGIEAATRAPHLWEAPRIEPVMDQGGYDRKIYKVTSAGGVYCVYYDSNHTPNGLDTMKNGIKPKIATCPREE